MTKEHGVHDSPTLLGGWRVGNSIRDMTSVVYHWTAVFGLPSFHPRCNCIVFNLPPANSYRTSSSFDNEH